MDESQYAGVGDLAWVLPKSSQCYYMLSHLSSPYSLLWTISLCLCLQVCLSLPFSLCLCVCPSHSFCDVTCVLMCYWWRVHTTPCMWSDVVGQFLTSILFKESLACCSVCQARQLTRSWDSLVCTSHFSVGPLVFLMCLTMSNFMWILNLGLYGWMARDLFIRPSL